MSSTKTRSAANWLAQDQLKREETAVGKMALNCVKLRGLWIFCKLSPLRTLRPQRVDLDFKILRQAQGDSAGPSRVEASRDRPVSRSVEHERSASALCAHSLIKGGLQNPLHPMKWVLLAARDLHGGDAPRSDVPSRSVWRSNGCKTPI